MSERPKRICVATTAIVRPPNDDRPGMPAEGAGQNKRRQQQQYGLDGQAYCSNNLSDGHTRSAAGSPDPVHDVLNSIRADPGHLDGVVSQTEAGPTALARRHAYAANARIARLIAIRYSQSSISALATLCFMSMVRNEWPWTKDHSI